MSVSNNIQLSKDFFPLLFVRSLGVNLIEGTVSAFLAEGKALKRFGTVSWHCMQFLHECFSFSSIESIENFNSTHAHIL